MVYNWPRQQATRIIHLISARLICYIESWGKILYSIDLTHLCLSRDLMGTCEQGSSHAGRQLPDVAVTDACRPAFKSKSPDYWPALKFENSMKTPWTMSENS